MKKISAGFANVIKNSTASVKKNTGVSVGFHDPDTWISTGNYALNFRISGDFKRGIPLGKVTMFAGESGCLPETAIVTVMNSENIITRVTVLELKELFHSGASVRIMTPDSFVPVTAWFDKGVLDMVSVSTESFRTECAVNHLLQRDNGDWVLASDVVVGDELLTMNGVETVTETSVLESAECYDFTVDHPNHRYYGDGFSSHNSGKSFIVSGNIAREAQAMGIHVVMIDTENALDSEWLEALGVNTDPEMLTKVNMGMIGDVAKFTYEFIEGYRKEVEKDPESMPKVLFIIDSIGMLNTETAIAQMADGNIKGDMGHKPKQLKAYITNCVNTLGALNIGMAVVNHSYESQDMFSPDPKISGGSGMVYASSMVIAMGKRKLKEDEEGNKTSTVNGIFSTCKIMKTRYNKPFEQVDIKIPYIGGMKVHSGLLDMFEKYEIITKSGNRLQYIDTDTGEIILKYRKEWDRNEGGCLDHVMEQFHRHPIIVALNSVPTVVDDEYPGDESESE